MHYRDFFDMLNALSQGEKIYFKPLNGTSLNAYHPEIKNKIFQISIESDGAYRISYIKLMQEWITPKNKLEQLFDDKKWKDYISFNLLDDYNQWQQTAQS